MPDAGHLAAQPAQLVRLVGDGEGVQVHDAVDGVVSLLLGHVVAQGAHVVAEGGVARGLHPGEDPCHPCIMALRTINHSRNRGR